MLQLKGQVHSWCKRNFQLVNSSRCISRIVWKGAHWVTKEKGASAEPSWEPGAEIPELPVRCCFFPFPSLLSSFRMRHLCSSPVWCWCPRASLMEAGEKPFNPYKGGSGLWCFRSFEEVAEVPLRWLPSAEMWQMGLFLLWPITLVSLCNKILGQKWKQEVRQPYQIPMGGDGICDTVNSRLK